MVKLKLDENFSSYLSEKLRNAGWDAESVWEEKLSGAPDEIIYEKCIEEKWCLVTFDFDFANIIRFPAEDTEGIIVVKPKQPVNLEVMGKVIDQLIEVLAQNDPRGSLWILEPHQLRIRKPREDQY